MADFPPAYALPNRVTPGNPVLFDAAICDGCNRCLTVCLEDVFVPNPEKGKPPLILHPDECWYCGLCQSICPTNAITVVFPEQMLRSKTDVVTLLGKVVE